MAQNTGALQFDPSTGQFSLANQPDPLGGALIGAYDLYKGVTGQDVSNAQTAAGIADPLMKDRPAYGQKLMDLITKPESFTQDPGYQFAEQQGEQAIQRAQTAKSGTTRTGALPIGMAKYATGFAEQAYDTRLGQLANLAGASTGSPATAGQITAGGFNNQDKSLAGGVAGLMSMLTSVFGPNLAQQLMKAISGGSGAIGNLGNNGGISGGNDLGEGDFRDLNDPWVHGSNDLGEGNFADLTNPWITPDNPLPDDFSWLIDFGG